MPRREKIHSGLAVAEMAEMDMALTPSAAGSEGKADLDRKAAQAATAAAADESELDFEDGPVRGLSREYKKTHQQYEESKTQARLEEAAVTLQSYLRTRLAKANLRSRCSVFKRLRYSQAHNALRGFSFQENKYRHEAYRMLVDMIGADLTFQDILNETISAATLRGMHEDLFSSDRRLRQLAARFFCEFAHQHRGNQRVLCSLNGLTVGNVRLFAVSSAFERRYRDWCAQHGLKVSYEGTVNFIEGLVQTACEYFCNTRPLERRKRHLRRSTFAYPNAYTYDELDPADCLIGVFLDPRPPVAMPPRETGLLCELRGIFQQAAELHGEEPDLFNSLVPAVPLYALLVAIKSRLVSGSLSAPLRDFLGDERDVVMLQAAGKADDPEQLRELKTVITQALGLSPGVRMPDDKTIREVAKRGASVLWAPVASRCTTFLLERTLREEHPEAFATVSKIFHAKDLKRFAGTDSRHHRLHELRESRYVNRLGLVVRLRGLRTMEKRGTEEGGGNDVCEPGIAQATAPQLLWGLLGALTEEDYSFSKLITGYKGAREPAFGIRTTVQSIRTNDEATAHKRARFSSGACNWDWIAWGEVMLLCRASWAKSSGSWADSTAMRGLRPQKEATAQLWAPTKVGNTARRAKVLQKMLRDVGDKVAPAPLDRLLQRCMEEELLLLSKALGHVNPILAPAYVGFEHGDTGKTEGAKQEERARRAPDTREARRGRYSCRQSTSSAAPIPEILQAKASARRARQVRRDRRAMAKQEERRRKQEERREAAREAAREKERAAQILSGKIELQMAVDRAESATERLEAERAASRASRRRFLRKEAAREALKQRHTKIISREAAERISRCLIREAQERERAPLDVQARIEQFDALLRTRNQLIFNQPRRSAHSRNDGNTPRDEQALPSQFAQAAAPMWALCKEGKPRRGGRRLNAPEVAPNSLAAHIAKAREREADCILVGGYLMKSKDVEDIMRKEFTYDEIKKYCAVFGNPNMPMRPAMLVAQHLYNKERAEEALKLNLRRHLKEDMDGVLADLQSDELKRPLANVMGAAPVDDLSDYEGSEAGTIRDLQRSMRSKNQLKPQAPAHVTGRWRGRRPPAEMTGVRSYQSYRGPPSHVQTKSS